MNSNGTYKELLITLLTLIAVFIWGGVFTYLYFISGGVSRLCGDTLKIQQYTYDSVVVSCGVIIDQVELIQPPHSFLPEESSIEESSTEEEIVSDDMEVSE